MRAANDSGAFLRAFGRVNLRATDPFSAIWLNQLISDAFRANVYSKNGKQLYVMAKNSGADRSLNK